MEISVYDKSFNKIAIIDNYTSAIFCKRYFEIGALDLQVEATTENLSIFKKDYFITRNDDDTVYRIKAIELNTQAEKDNSLIIGAVDCKSILGQRIMYLREDYSGTVENYIRLIINMNIIGGGYAEREIKNFALKDAKGFTETTRQKFSYRNLADEVIGICKSYGYGWKVTLEKGWFYFDLYKGVNRSKEQTENPPIIFSPEYDNLTSSKYNFDETEYKNVAIVLGAGDGEDDSELSRVRVIVNNDMKGLDRYETFVDSSISQDDTTISEFQNQLKSQGRDELSKLMTTISFEGEVVADSYIYKTDYDIGDIVTVTNEYGISVNARIVEVVETWDNEGYSLELKFEYMEVAEFEFEETSVEGLATENLMLMTAENGIALLSEDMASVEGESVRISELPTATEIESGNILPIVQNGTTKQIDYSVLENNFKEITSDIETDLSNAEKQITELKTQVGNLSNYDDTEIKQSITELEESIPTTVNNAIAKVVNNAPEDFNTLKEMSDWIAEHENDATAMNTAILENKNDLAQEITDRKNADTSLQNQINGKADSSHTHDDRYYTESEIDTKLSNKVDKVSGKGLSTNDYTTTEKNKLAGIETGANNYSHPTSHPANMITGLSTVATSGSYNDLSDKPTITNGTNGKDGVGVSSIQQTTTSTADGGTNVITATLTDGTTSTFNIKNGSKGSAGATGAEGLGVWRSSTATTTSTTSITLSTITIPSGRKVKVGDLIIANTTYSYMYRVTAVSSTTATVTYICSLRGATGATGTFNGTIPKQKFFGSPNGTTYYIMITSTNSMGGVVAHVKFNGSFVFNYNGTVRAYNPMGYNYGVTGWYWGDSGKLLWLRVAGYREISIEVPSIDNNSTAVTIADWTSTAPTGINFSDDFYSGVVTGSFANKYLKFGEKAIMQCGTVAKGSDLSASNYWNTTITFPVEFANTDYIITCGVETKNAGEEIYIYNKTTTGATIELYNRNSSTVMATPKINWIAIGEEA